MRKCTKTDRTRLLEVMRGLYTKATSTSGTWLGLTRGPPWDRKANKKFPNQHLKVSVWYNARLRRAVTHTRFRRFWRTSIITYFSMSVTARFLELTPAYIASESVHHQSTADVLTLNVVVQGYTRNTTVFIVFETLFYFDVRVVGRIDMWRTRYIRKRYRVRTCWHSFGGTPASSRRTSGMSDWPVGRPRQCHPSRQRWWHHALAFESQCIQWGWRQH